MTEKILLDGGSFIAADLTGKPLLYAGGQPPDLLNAKLDKAQWYFEGTAANTLAMMAVLDILEPGFAQRAINEFKKQMSFRYAKPRH